MSAVEDEKALKEFSLTLLKLSVPQKFSGEAGTVTFERWLDGLKTSLSLARMGKYLESGTYAGVEEEKAKMVGSFVKDALVLGSQARDLVTEESLPAKMLEKISGVFAPKEDYTRRSQLIEFESLVLRAEPSAKGFLGVVQEHVTTFTRIYHSLRALKVKAVEDEEFVATRLIASVQVDSRLSQYRKDMLSLSKADFTLDRAQKELLRTVEHFEREQTREAERDVAHGMGAKGVRGRKPNDRKKEIECWNCRKRGHYQSECPERSGDEEHDGRKGRAQGAFGFAFTAYNPASDRRSVQQKCSEWIPDSGASDHMTAWRDFFTRYQKFDGTVVLVNGRRVKAVGIGDVERSMLGADGKWRRRLLTNVWHVPSLQVNLLSIPAVTAKGHKVVCEKDWLQILERGSGLPVFVAKKVRKTYVSIGCRKSTGDEVDESSRKIAGDDDDLPQGTGEPAARSGEEAPGRPSKPKAAFQGKREVARDDSLVDQPRASRHTRVVRGSGGAGRPDQVVELPPDDGKAYVSIAACEVNRTFAEAAKAGARGAKKGRISTTPRAGGVLV